MRKRSSPKRWSAKSARLRRSEAVRSLAAVIAAARIEMANTPIEGNDVKALLLLSMGSTEAFILAVLLK